MPQYYAPKLLISSYALQLVALLAIALLGLPLGPPHHLFEINVGDSPIRAVLAIVTVPVATVLVALGWVFLRNLSTKPNAAQVADIDVSRRRIYLFVAAALQLLYWPAALLSYGFVGYVVRILEGALMVAPFIAGRDSHGDRAMRCVWCPTILLNAVVAIAVGGRSKALMPCVLYGAGWISVMPKHRRRLAAGIGLLALVPLIQLAGALGVVRDEMGRDRLEMVQADHIREVFTRVGEEMAPGATSDSERRNVQGVSRMLAWSNVVVPVMTPDSVPYRGFEGFLDEALQTFRIARVSGLTPDDLYDAGLLNAGARPYGFSVNANTSVEFTVVADGWSRGGFVISLLFAATAALWLTLGEALAVQLDKSGIGPMSILLLPIARAAFFDANGLPLVAVVRSLVLYLFAITALMIVVEMFRQPVSSINRRRILEMKARRLRLRPANFNQ